MVEPHRTRRRLFGIVGMDPCGGEKGSNAT